MNTHLGRDDEVFIATKYAKALSSPSHPVKVELIDGVSHMGIVSQPQALERVVAAVRQR